MELIYAIILLCTVHTAISDVSPLFGESPRQDLNFVDLARYDGYTAEQHYVTTKDGYILGLFRMPINKNCAASNGTIMFMHGLLLSGDDCIVPGPEKSHCYIYADNCYDIWVPNVRGSFYSRNHTTLNPNIDPRFWDFSIDEMAIYDLPAVIDYVLLKSGETQISYVAHSQGVAILLILCSKQPEYNTKIKVGLGLSPTAWLDHSPYSVINTASLIAPVATILNPLLSVELAPRNGLVQTSAELLCGTTDLAYPICSVLVFAIYGYNRFQITSDVLPVVVGHTPSGTSLRNFNRWAEIRNNGFTEYDYGLVQNLLKYGQARPPQFDLSGVTMPWVFIGSENDLVATIPDIKTLISKLQNASLCVLSDKFFGHIDYIYGKDIPNYITPVVLSTIQTGGYTCP